MVVVVAVVVVVEVVVVVMTLVAPAIAAAEFAVASPFQSMDILCHTAEYRVVCTDTSHGDGEESCTQLHRCVLV